MQLKNNLMTLLFFALTANVMAFEEVYYGDGIKDVTVNSKEPSLLVFPSPPVARVCHPSGVVDFFPVETGEMESNTTLNSINWNQTTAKLTGDGTEKMLKLRPYQNDETTLCDVKLANQETVTLRFKTSENIKRPSLEFVNIFSKEARKERRYETDSLNVFQRFVSGGELFDFYDITTSKSDPVSKSTRKALYEITYIGTDRERYKVWGLRATPSGNSLHLPELKNVQLNQLYFSAWKSGKGATVKPSWVEDQPVSLFILSSNDISTEELLEKLP